MVAAPAEKHSPVQHRLIPWMLLVAIIATTLATLLPVLRDASAQERAANEAQGQGESKDLRLREGTKIVGQLGYFKITGDRATFFTQDGKHRFGGLENLSLARIVNTISEDTDQLKWSVDGTITEYRGSNYLLISKAILKTKAPQATESAGAVSTSESKSEGT